MQIFGLVFLLIVGLVGISVLRHRRLKSACNAAFLRIYAEWTPLPKFEMSYSYSYPAFKVLFKSKPEVHAANQAGLNANFLRVIDELCKDQGPKSRPFLASHAVFFTYEGHLDDISISSEL